MNVLQCDLNMLQKNQIRRKLEILSTKVGNNS